MDARCIRIKKFADTKISGYVWTGPKSENRERFYFHLGAYALKKMTLSDLGICILCRTCGWRERPTLPPYQCLESYGGLKSFLQKV